MALWLIRNPVQEYRKHPLLPMIKKNLFRKNTLTSYLSKADKLKNYKLTGGCEAAGLSYVLCCCLIYFKYFLNEFSISFITSFTFCEKLSGSFLVPLSYTISSYLEINANCFSE